MTRGIRVVAVSAVVIAASLAIQAEAPQNHAVDIQLQLGRLLFEDGRYAESLEAYRKALMPGDATRVREARFGVIQSALRVAEFDVARHEADTLIKEAPGDPEAISLYADSRWAAGLFVEAEARYGEALAMAPAQPRARHGLARSLMARGQLDLALDEAQEALKLAPRDLEIHHTVGAIYERMHKFEEAASAFSNYVNLLPDKDHSAKAAWSRAEIKFLRSFGQRIPFEGEPGTEDAVYTIPFRLVKDKVIIRAKVNRGSTQDFVVDTGSENTVLSRQTAERLGISPVTVTLSAGVGEVGLRGLQLARIDNFEIGPLKLRNVPCVIKNPALHDLPTRESESVSPIALGFSMVIDYKRSQLTIGRHLPEESADFELPLRVYRLATVLGVVDGEHPANFVIDTGGEVISISQATATSLGRPEPAHKTMLKVFGTSGWDRDAFLMPGVDLAFDAIRYRNFSVVVLNLRAPSALLGFQLGGIVGHHFLKDYRVGIDLEKSVLRLKAAS